MTTDLTNKFVDCNLRFRNPENTHHKPRHFSDA